jgi:glycosyltransferase involved in cell wall biosynthesis
VALKQVTAEVTQHDAKYGADDEDRTAASGVKATVVPSLDPRYGGPSVSVPALVRAMHDLDPTARLYCAGAGWPGEPGWPDYVRRFEDDWPQPLRRSRRLRRALESDDLALVHHHALWLPTLGYAYRATRHHDCPLVISPRGMLSPYALARSQWRKRLAAIVVHPGALRRAAGWHATSDIEADDIRRAGYRQPVIVAPNGVEVSAWNEPVDRQAWLGRHPELAGKRILHFFSRLHSKKRVDWLIDAWAELASRHPDWHLLVVGNAEEFSVEQLRARAADRGIAERTTVAGTDGLAKPYRLAELYVLPTASENFGMTVAEALASGVPALVTTDAPWEAVNRLGCGACVPMADWLKELETWLRLSSDELRQRGEIALQYVTTTFSWEKQAQSLLDFYSSLTA